MASFRCEPPLIKLTRYSIGTAVRHRLDVINVCPSAQRFGALLLTDEADRRHWRLEFEPQGNVAPGLRQPFTLIYTPPDLERRTVQIRITAEVGPPSIVTVIADAGASTASWTPCLPGGVRGSVPPRVDFGKIPLLHAAERTLTIFNEGVVPVDFHASFLRPHAEFDFSPKSGTVAPGDSVTFTLSYAPLTQTTAVCEVLIATSVPDLPPAKLTLTGCAAPGGVLEHAEQQEQLLRRSRRAGDGSIGSLGSVGSETQPLQSHEAGATTEGKDDGNQGSDGDGSGGEDGKFAVDSLNLRRGRGARFARTDPGQLLIEERLAAFKATQERKLLAALEARAAAQDADAAIIAAGAAEEEARHLQESAKHAATAMKLRAGFVQVDGVRVPEYLNTVAGASYVLTQLPGRLKPKEIAIAVAQRKAQEAAAAAGQARMLALERKAAAAAEAEAVSPEPTASASSDSDSLLRSSSGEGLSGGSAGFGASSPLQAAAGDLAAAVESAARAPKARRQQQHKQRSLPPPPRGAPPLHSLGLRSILSAEFASSPLYSLLQTPSSLTGMAPIEPIIEALEQTPPHSPLRSGCPLLDELVNGWLTAATTAATGRAPPPAASSNSTADAGRAALAALTADVDPRILRLSLFQHAVADISSRERAVTFASREQRGEAQLTPQEVAQVKLLRAQLLRAERLVLKRAQATIRQTLVVPSSATPGSSASLLPPALREPVLQQLLAPMSGLHPVPAQVVKQAWAAKPSFSEAKSEPFAQRRDAAAAFRSALSAHILQQRAARRLRLLMDVVQRAAAEAGVPVPSAVLAAAPPATETAAAVPVAVSTDLADAPFEAVAASPAGNGVPAAAAAARAALERLRAAVQRVASRGEEHPVIKALKSSSAPQASVSMRPTAPQTASAASQRRLSTAGNRQLVAAAPSTSLVDAPPAPPSFAALMAQALTADRICRPLLYTRPAEDALPMPEAAAAAGAGTAVGAKGDDAESGGIGWWVPGAAPLPCWLNEVAPFDEPTDASEEWWPVAEVRGYGPVQLPLVPAMYQPTEAGRPLRDGALHETAASGVMPYPWALPQYELPATPAQAQGPRGAALAAVAGAGDALTAVVLAAGRSGTVVPPAFAERATRPLLALAALLGGDAAAPLVGQLPVHARFRRALLPPSLLPPRSLPGLLGLLPLAVPRPPPRFWDAHTLCALPGSPPEWLPAFFLWPRAGVVQPFQWAFPGPPARLVSSLALWSRRDAPTPPPLHAHRQFAARVATMPPLALGLERYDASGAPTDGLVRDANGEILTRSEVDSWSSAGGSLRCAHVGALRLRPRDAGWSVLPPDLAAEVGVPPSLVVAAPASATASDEADAEGGAGTPAAAAPGAAAPGLPQAAAGGARPTTAASAAGQRSALSPVRGGAAAGGKTAGKAQSERPTTAALAASAAGASAAAGAASSKGAAAPAPVTRAPEWSGSRPLTRPLRLDAVAAAPPAHYPPQEPLGAGGGSDGGAGAAGAAANPSGTAASASALPPLPPAPLPLQLGLRLPPEASPYASRGHLPTSARPLADFTSRLLVPAPLSALVDGRPRRETDVVPPAARGYGVDEGSLYRSLVAGGAGAGVWPPVEPLSASAPQAKAAAATPAGRWDDDSESEPEDEGGSSGAEGASKGRRGARAQASGAPGGGAAASSDEGGKQVPELHASRLGALSLDALVALMTPHATAMAKVRAAASPPVGNAAAALGGGATAPLGAVPFGGFGAGGAQLHLPGGGGFLGEAAAAAPLRGTTGSASVAASVAGSVAAAAAAGISRTSSAGRSAKDKLTLAQQPALDSTAGGGGWGERGADGGWFDVALDSTPTVDAVRSARPWLSPQEAALLAQRLYRLRASQEWAQSTPVAVAGYNAVIGHPGRRFIADGNAGYGRLLALPAADAPHVARPAAGGADV